MRNTREQADYRNIRGLWLFGWSSICSSRVGGMCSRLYHLFKVCCIQTVTICCLTACATVFPPPAKRMRLEKPGALSGAALSPDGDHLALLTNRGVHLYRMDTFEEVWFEAHLGKSATDVAFSPDGTLIATKFSWHSEGMVGPGAEIILWDAVTGRQVRRWTDDISFSDETLSAFSPDGTALASGEREHMATVWDTDTGEPICKIIYRDRELDAYLASLPMLPSYLRWEVAWSPDGERLAFGIPDGRVVVWDIEDDELAYLLGESIMSLGPGESTSLGWVWNLAFSPDGSKLALSSPGAVDLCDTTTGECLMTLSPRNKVRPESKHDGDLAWSLDGTMLASSVDSAIITLWDANTGDQLLRLDGHTGGVLDVVFSPDGKRLLSASRSEIIEWDVETGKPLRIVEVGDQR